MNLTSKTEPPKDPYLKMEFDVFLEAYSNIKQHNWSLIAQGLGVSRRTIDRWKKHPKAQKMHAEALQETIKAMEDAGSDDWKMHREKLAMLGINNRQTIEHEVGESITDVLNGLESDYDELANQARQALAGETSKQVVENDTPVQD